MPEYYFRPLTTLSSGLQLYLKRDSGTAGLTTLLKNKLWHRCFSVNFAKSLWRSLPEQYRYPIQITSSFLSAQDNDKPRKPLTPLKHWHKMG